MSDIKQDILLYQVLLRSQNVYTRWGVHLIVEEEWLHSTLHPILRGAWTYFLWVQNYCIIYHSNKFSFINCDSAMNNIIIIYINKLEQTKRREYIFNHSRNNSNYIYTHSCDPSLEPFNHRNGVSDLSPKTSRWSPVNTVTPPRGRKPERPKGRGGAKRWITDQRRRRWMMRRYWSRFRERKRDGGSETNPRSSNKCRWWCGSAYIHDDCQRKINKIKKPNKLVGIIKNGVRGKCCCSWQFVCSVLFC